MDSIYFALTLVVVVWLLVWSLRNDKARSIDDQSGLFAMRSPGNKSRKSTKKQPYVPGQDAAKAAENLAQEHSGAESPTR